jgi:hypothetical protein
LPHREDEN